MKTKLKKFIPMLALPAFALLATSCDSDTPLGEQNDVLGNAEFTIPEVLVSGDSFKVRSFVLTRPLDLTFDIESGSTLSYNDSRFPVGVGPYTNINYSYTTASTTRTLAFSLFNAEWDTDDDNGTTEATEEMPDPTVDDTNILEDLLKEAVANDESIRTAAAALADTETKENAQILLEALSLNADLREIDMIFDRQGAEVRVAKSIRAVLQLDGSSILDRVGVPLQVSLNGSITRALANNGTVTETAPTGFTFTAAGEVSE